MFNVQEILGVNPDLLNKQTKDGKTALIVSAKNNKMGVYNWLSTNEVNENLNIKIKQHFSGCPEPNKLNFKREDKILTNYWEYIKGGLTNNKAIQKQVMDIVVILLVMDILVTSDDFM